MTGGRCIEGGAAVAGVRGLGHVQQRWSLPLHAVAFIGQRRRHRVRGARGLYLV